MGSVKHRFFVEYYVDGGWGCPDLNLMGYGDFEELSKDMIISINKLLGKDSPSSDSKQEESK